MSALAHSMERELDLERRLVVGRARRGLLNFIRYTKPDYEISWHHRVMCRKLNAVVEGRIKRLIITMPPRHGKSEAVSIRFPAYLLGRMPKAQIIAASYNATLAAKMNRSVQRVIDSPAYHDVFPGTLLNSSNVRTTAQGNWLRNSDEFEIVGHGGFYRSAGVGGSATGYGATVGIIDDYCKNRDEAGSQVYRDKVYDWFQSTFYTRLEKGGSLVICATRWHEDELIGRLLKQAREDPRADQWHLLNLPAVAEEEGRDEEDPRALGETLWPNKYSKERMEQMRVVVGEREWTSLYQQRPSPAEGAIIKNSWWRYWRDLPAEIDLLVASADLNAKESDASDYTVITVWARNGHNFYLLDMVRQQMGWIQQKAALRRVLTDYPDLNAIYIEDASNGIALIQEARQSVPGVVAVQARGSKMSRLQAVSPLIEAGNVFLPDPAMPGYEWVGRVKDEMAVFPNGAHDDIVDSVSQALSQLRPRYFDCSFSAEAISKESFVRGLEELD